jgi:hypothetical protein
MRTLLGALGVALLFGSAQAQDKPKPIPAHSKVDQQKVDDAIERGCKWLISTGFAFTTFSHGHRNQPAATQAYAELILLTLAHSGFYKDGDPAIQGLTDHVLNKQIGSTYTASLMAMALVKLNPKKYQMRIAQCAQFLCDNQCTNGQWDYGEPIPDDKMPKDPKKDVTTGGPRPKKEDVATSTDAATNAGSAPPPPSDAPSAPAGKPGTQVKDKGDRGKTKALPRIPVRKQKPGPPNGDNSNSQYAALGLRACLDADIDVDPSVLQRARQWWLKSQYSDGGWGYNDHGETGGGAENEGGISNTSYGSMTVGAVGALCIYDYYAGVAYKTDANVLKGLEWIAKNFDVTKNPKKVSFAYLYYLYGLERAGMLYGTETFGPKEWYPEGANHLLGTQQGQGNWNSGDKFPSQSHVDTCFAILFLRRGTLPLRPPPSVATGDGRGNRDTQAEGGLVRPGVPNNAPGVPNPAGGNSGPKRDGLGGRSKVVEELAAGWTLLYSGNGPDADKLAEIRGKTGVLSTYPPNQVTTPTLRRTVDLGPASKQVLKVVVGHHETGAWTLVVRIDGKEALSKAVSSETSQAGWLEVSVDLAPYAGKSVLLELVAVPGGVGYEVAYWSEIALKEP